MGLQPPGARATPTCWHCRAGPPLRLTQPLAIVVSYGVSIIQLL